MRFSDRYVQSGSIIFSFLEHLACIGLKCEKRGGELGVSEEGCLEPKPLS